MELIDIRRLVAGLAIVLIAISGWLLWDEIPRGGTVQRILVTEPADTRSGVAVVRPALDTTPREHRCDRVRQASARAVVQVERSLVAIDQVLEELNPN